MILSFSQKWPARMGDLAGKPNNFEQKIWNSLLDMDYELYSDYLHPDGLPHQSFGIHSSYKEKQYAAKLHTIRHDPHNRWKPGMKIHPVINNRTKDYFQFAPVLTCTGIQEFEVVRSEYHGHKGYDKGVWVLVDDIVVSEFWLNELAINDGFESVEQFLKWFDTDFKGKIIHWTPIKYNKPW